MDKKNISFTLGARLKELRQECGLSHDKLREQLKVQYGISVSRDSLMAYEVADETRSKADKLPNLGMRVEYLYCLADFFGVSIDYLLGKTDISSEDIQTREICERIGLSDDTVRLLSVYSRTNTLISSFIVRFFEDIVAGDSLTMICDFLEQSAHASAIDELRYQAELDGLVNGEISPNRKAKLKIDNIIDSMNGTHGGDFKISAEDAAGYFLTQAQNIAKGSIDIILENMEEELCKIYISNGFIPQTPQKRVWRLIEDDEQ